MKLTEWFSHDVKPVRVGYYQVQGREHWRSQFSLKGKPIRFFDGEVWRSWENGPQSIFGTHHSHQWRGLAEPPK